MERKKIETGYQKLNGPSDSSLGPRPAAVRARAPPHDHYREDQDFYRDDNSLRRRQKEVEKASYDPVLPKLQLKTETLPSYPAGPEPYHYCLAPEQSWSLVWDHGHAHFDLVRDSEFETAFQVR